MWFDSPSRQVEVDLGLLKKFIVICYIFEASGIVGVLLLVPLTKLYIINLFGAVKLLYDVLI